jgi:hypothetical protein
MKLILGFSVAILFTLGIVYKVLGGNRKTRNCVTNDTFQLIKNDTIEHYKQYTIVRSEKEISLKDKSIQLLF